MKNNSFTISRFGGVLFVILFIAFLLHVFLFSDIESIILSQLFFSYIVNYILAVSIFTGLIFLKRKHVHLLGFAYLGGSLLKFAVFFIFFYPVFKQDGVIDRQESLVFLVPYFICLFYETFYLVRMLNKQ